MKEIQSDVMVIGAGVTGLMLTKKLSGLGMSVALIERGDKLAVGPSTKNEGWLHRGTYHATSIQDRDTAISVAQRCIYGHEQIKNYAPEAIEDQSTPSYAIVKDPERVGEVVSRWDEAEVTYKPISTRDLIRREPNVNPDGISEAFKVGDVAVNTRLLYRKLLNDASSAGARIFPSSRVIFDDQDEMSGRIISPGDSNRVRISSELVIHANGYGMRDEFVDQFGIDIPLRYWKSHLKITERLGHASVFCIDPKEAAMINHGNYSITGLNEDAVVVESPDFDPIPENVSDLEIAMKRLFIASDTAHQLATACVKVDLAPNVFERRSLSITLFEPKEGHMCVLPGKMTEAPFTTDMMSGIIYDRLSMSDPIALRPMDMLK